MKNIFLFFTIILVLSACSTKKQPETMSRSSIPIDFFIDNQNDILLYANANGVDSLLFVLDNGTPRTIIPDEIFQRYPVFDKSHTFNHPKRGRLSASTLNISLPDYKLSIDTFWIFSDTRPINGKSECWLGVELFMNNIIQLDFINNKMLILNKLPNNIKDFDCFVMHQHIDENNDDEGKYRYVIIPDFVDKEGNIFSGNFMLDLGAHYSLITKDFASKVDFEKVAEHSEYWSSRICSTPTINSNVFFMEDDGNVHHDPYKEGFIGVDFLKNYDVIFDYPHNMFYLKPNKKQKP